MAEQEDIDLMYPYKLIKIKILLKINKSTCGIIFTENKLETGKKESSTIKSVSKIHRDSGRKGRE